MYDINVYTYIYIYIYDIIYYRTPRQAPSDIREFRDVVFEDVVFNDDNDNNNNNSNSSVTPY